MADIFDGFNADIIAERYIERHSLSGIYAENVRAKYDELQLVIDNKGITDESLSPYFGESTRTLHRLLFQKLFRAIAAESCTIALFIALISVAYENTRNTESVVCTSKIGRKVLSRKLLASITSGGIFFVLITGLALTIFFTLFDWSPVWNNNVSSVFNSAVNEYSKPFITWHSFTVSEYLCASIGVTAGLTLCFSLLGFAVGTFIRGGYASTIAAISLCVVMYVIKPIAPIGGVICSTLNLTPVQLWANVGDWFTDGYADILWANFECWGLTASFAILAVLSFAAVMNFKRRDLI